MEKIPIEWKGIQNNRKETIKVHGKISQNFVAFSEYMNFTHNDF